jgi:hypothetical protein
MFLDHSNCSVYDSCRGNICLSRRHRCAHHLTKVCRLVCHDQLSCGLAASSHAYRLNEQVQQLLGSQAKLLEAQVHAAKQPANQQQQGHQERGCSPLPQALSLQSPQPQQQQLCTQYAVGTAGSRQDGMLGTSMQDFEQQLQQLQLQVDNMGGEEQHVPAAMPEQTPAAAGADGMLSCAQGMLAAGSPTRRSSVATQQQQQQLIQDQAATIADLKKVIAGMCSCKGSMCLAAEVATATAGTSTA